MSDTDNTDKYYHIGGQICLKDCSTCAVEWLDDQCSTEYERCEACKVGDVYTKWAVNKWGRDNGQLWNIGGKPIVLDKDKIKQLHIEDLEERYTETIKKAAAIQEELIQLKYN